ncbi:MAG: extracellular solute-binding protein [Clostridia bacterium]|nr:extracellular solute-binding protein [Clostridia bacterium]
MKKATILLLLAALLLSASCGGEAPSADTTAANAGETTAAETKAVYPYAAEDFGGYEFTFLNQDACNWASRLLVPTESTGELVNDAMYQRNMKVEETLGIKITEIVNIKDELQNLIKAAVNAGDAVYDVTMCPIDNTGALLLDGYFVDLNEISTLHLEDAWWDHTVLDASTIDGRCYFATSDITFFPFEATWVIYFNKEKMDALNLEYPYQLVRDGKWTIDKLTEYAKTAANLNGQDSFAYNQESGTADYGIASHDQFMEVLAFGFGETFLKTGSGMPVFNGTGERLVTTFEKIAGLTVPDGAYVDRNADNITGGDDRMTLEYKKDRFMFMAETLGHIASLRDNKSNFGVIPVPKLDEAQKEYHSLMASWGTLMTTIPQSCENPERAGMVLDALAYESSISMIEPYYNAYLTQKGVRDEDSADMLQIVRTTRSINVGKMFGWTTSVINSVNSALSKGDSALSSTLASSETSVNEAIKKTYDTLK